MASATSGESAQPRTCTAERSRVLDYAICSEEILPSNPTCLHLSEVPWKPHFGLRITFDGADRVEIGLQAMQNGSTKNLLHRASNDINATLPCLLTFKSAETVGAL